MVATILASLSFAVQNLACKAYAKRFPEGIVGLALVNSLALAVVCAIMALLGGAAAISAAAFGIAACFGVTFVATLFAMVAAMAAGPLGVTTLICNASMLIPTVAGLMFWNERLTPLKGIGVALIACLLVLSALGSRDGARGGVKWLMLTLGAFAGNGILSILQRLMSTYCAEVTANAFTFWTSLISGGICLAVMAIGKWRGADLTRWMREKKTLGLCALGIGAGTAGGNCLSILALTALPAVVMFPIRQGLLVLMMWLAGIVLYHEKMSLRGLVILVTGLAGMMLLNIG